MEALDVVNSEIVEGLGLVQPPQETAAGRPKSNPRCLWGGHKRPFTVVHYERMRDKGHKLKKDRLELSRKRKYPPCRQSFSGTGCSESLCHLHPWSSSRLKWAQPEKPDLTVGPALSRRLD